MVVFLMRTGYTMHIVLGLAAIECDVLESLVFHVWTIELRPLFVTDPGNHVS